MPPNTHIYIYTVQHKSCVTVVPVQMKNLDSPTLNSTLFKDMDTCSAAVMEEEEGQRKTERERKEEGLLLKSAGER